MFVYVPDKMKVRLVRVLLNQHCVYDTGLL